MRWRILATSPSFATDNGAEMNTPLARYDRAVAEGGLDADPAQRTAMATLEVLYHALLAAGASQPSWHRLLPHAWRRSPTPLRGVYLWGGVGRGKTMLMDMFYQCLPITQKRRSHFHRFMNDVHAQLHSLRDERDPLQRVAGRIAATTRIICFDEFFVSDIADAMILGTLFEALFRRGVSLVATSNVAPSQLYHEGLQRARFLPAIALLEQHCTVVHLASPTDYRLRLLERANVYQTPADAQAHAELARCFDAIAAGSARSQAPLEVLGREIPVVVAADGVAWFEFSALCDGPRSQHDYIEIARCLHTVVVSEVPRFDATLDNQARRFMAMVDEFYDRRVKLVLSAATPPDRLYGGERLAFEFQRTCSRLQEMQSHAYLACEHRA